MTRDPAPRLVDDRDWVGALAMELERAYPRHRLLGQLDAWRAEQREQRRRPSEAPRRRPLPWEQAA